MAPICSYIHVIKEIIQLRRQEIKFMSPGFTSMVSISLQMPTLPMICGMDWMRQGESSYCL